MHDTTLATVKIPLTGRGYALVDAEDAPKLLAYTWDSVKIGHCYYASSNGKEGQPKRIYMHRIVMGVTDSHVIVDHIDRDGLNNQKHNLRLVNKSQNACNARVRDTSTTGFKGVSSYTRKGREGIWYRASANIGSRRHTLVCHTRSLEKAVNARIDFEESNPDFFPVPQKRP